MHNDGKEKLIDTRVISGHGKTSGETNFTSTDKIYYLSSVEVYSGTLKQNNGSNYAWWLRSSDSTEIYSFGIVSSDGYANTGGAIYNTGVTPAFRIG